MFETINIIYFCTLFAYTTVEVTLLLLNVKYAKNVKNNTAIELLNIYSDDEIEKSLNYTQEKTHISVIQTIYSSILIFIFIYFGFFGEIDSYLRSSISNFYVLGISYILSISLIFAVLQLPFSLYRTFKIEEKYGFNTMSFKLWCIDILKSTALSLVITVPLLFALLYFMENSGEYWWVYAFLLIAFFQLLLLIIFPVLIAPLFNKFEELKDEELGQKILALANELDFEASGIYQMDGSKRSNHANAYFSGFGKSKRIVLFDTLLEKLEGSEILAVLAHEIGHSKKKHIVKALVYALVLLFIAFYILSLLINYKDFYLAFGISIPSSYALLVLFNIAFEPIMFFVSPISSIFSRKNEYEADEFAVHAVGEAKPLIDSLKKLSKASLSNLTPHPMYSFFHYSHPTLVERIDAMKKIKVNGEKK